MTILLILVFCIQCPALNELNYNLRTLQINGRWKKENY